MILRKVRYFSSKNKKGDKDKLSEAELEAENNYYGRRGTLLTLGAMVPPSLIAKNHIKKSHENMESNVKSYEELSKEDKELLKKLHEKYKDRVHIIDHPIMPISGDLNNSFYLHSDKPHASDEEAKKVFDEIKKKYPKGTQSGEEQKRILGKLHALGDVVNLGIADPGTLGHELGHMEIERGLENAKHGKIRSFLDHAAQSKTATIARGVLGRTALPSGYIAGMHGWKVDEDDDDKLKFQKKSLILPTVSSALSLSQPMYESSASHRGLRMLKELGASEEALKRYKENLVGHKSALSTYKSAALANVAMNAAGTGIGLVLGHMRAEDLKDKKYISKRDKKEHWVIDREEKKKK